MEAVNMKYVAENGPPQDGILIDLRSTSDYRKGHIPGAINVPYEKLSLEKVGFDRTKKLIFYCRHGSHSLAACTLYEKYGYRTCNLLGGYEAYRRALNKKVFDGRR